jgi:hypothetical protein
MQPTETTPAPTLGEAAVDGLLAGVGAGVLMAAYLALAGLTVGVGPDEWLGRLDPSGTTSPAIGGLAHLAVAGVYGAFFGSAWRLTPRRPRGLAWGLLCGPAYGLALWLVAVTASASTGGLSPFGELPAGHLVAAHCVYGLTLGALFQRGRPLTIRH